MRLLFRNTLAVASAMTLLFLLGGAAVADAESGLVGPPRPAGTIAPGWGWAMVRHPATAGYTLRPDDGRDSAGRHPTYQRLGLGESLVAFPGFSNGFVGVPSVTALSRADRACTVSDWESVGHPRVFIHCFRADGALADTPFTTSLVLHGDASPRIAYLYGSCSGSGCNASVAYDPDPDPVTVERSGTRSYVVGLPGMATGVGNVQVSAQAGFLFACRAVSLSSSGGARIVEVECRDGTGTLSDSGLLLVYTKAVGLTGVAGRKAAHLLATGPGATSYHPAAGLGYSSAGSVPTVTRNGQGTYLVVLPGMPGGGSAGVTPLGSGQARCTLTSISSTGTPQRIGVRCNDPNGTASDSKFSLTYTH